MLAVWKCVRIAIRYVHTVIFILKTWCEWETKEVLVPSLPSPFLRWEIQNVWSETVPANISELSLFLGVHKGLHSRRVQRITFHEVNYVEFIWVSFSGISYLKEEPLAIHGSGVVIEFQLKVILVVSNLNNSLEVPTLETRFKDQGWVLWVF
jgi:hypothetical protein